MTLNIGVLGCCGRMGRALLAEIHASDALNLTCAIARDSSDKQGQDVGTLMNAAPVGVAVQKLTNGFGATDVLIDFTTPDLSLAVLEHAQRHNLPVVLGTTGFTECQMAHVQQASEQISIAYAANYSVGINILLSLLPRVAQSVGMDADIEIIEAHHRHKIDAPSGTALALGETIADTLDIDLNKNAIYGRQGQIGARPNGQIGFSTIRAGEIIGDHTVLFGLPSETLEFTHKVSKRSTFAQGALRAAQWLYKQPVGLYSMQDVLGL